MAFSNQSVQVLMYRRLKERETERERERERERAVEERKREDSISNTQTPAGVG